jgi:hypothetical protein
MLGKPGASMYGFRGVTKCRHAQLDIRPSPLAIEEQQQPDECEGE